MPISMIIGNLVLNLNIILIILAMLVKTFDERKLEWTKNEIFKILIILYIYLVLNSIYNFYNNPNYGIDGIIRSIGFIKFIFLTFSFQLLITKKNEINKIFLNWLIITLVVIFDVYFELFFGKNIFGFQSLDTTRIISFFYDESVVGAFIFAFSFILFAFFISKKLSFSKKLLLNLFLFFIPLSVLVTGERSNFIKATLLFIVILFLLNSSFLILGKKKSVISFIIIIFLTIFLNENIYTKQTAFFKRIITDQKTTNFTTRFENIKYFSHYDVAFEIFKDNPLIGVGNKNFRKECSNEIYFKKEKKFSTQRCTTHPHQVHFELLSEQGLIGYILFFYLMFVFLKRNFKKYYYNENIFGYSLNFYLLIFLIPLLPGGSIFSTLNGSLFWIIFSLANFENKFKV